MPKHSTCPSLYESTYNISVTILKRLGILKDNTVCRTSLSFKRNNKETGSITVRIDTICNSPFIEFDYSCNGVKINYAVPLIKVHSNLGKGFYWLFKCRFTNKLCRKLYLHGNYFKHTSGCKDFLYEKQTHAKKGRLLSKVFEVYYADQPIYQKYFKSHYAGKPTKRYKAYIQRLNKAEKIPIEELFLESKCSPKA